MGDDAEMDALRIDRAQPNDRLRAAPARLGDDVGVDKIHLKGDVAAGRLGAGADRLGEGVVPGGPARRSSTSEGRPAKSAS